MCLKCKRGKKNQVMSTLGPLSMSENFYWIILTIRDFSVCRKAIVIRRLAPSCGRWLVYRCTVNECFFRCAFRSFPNVEIIIKEWHLVTNVTNPTQLILTAWVHQTVTFFLLLENNILLWVPVFASSKKSDFVFHFCRFIHNKWHFISNNGTRSHNCDF